MRTLLIVDDEPASRKVIKAFLDFKALGIDKVLEAGNGQEAIRLIQSGAAPQIVISDMEMPVVGGIQFLDYLSDCHPEICVIVVSGYFDFQYTHAAIKNGAQDYLLKPIDPGQIRAAVQKCVTLLERAQKMMPVNVEGSLTLDAKTYREILTRAEQMRRLLENSTLRLITDALCSLRALFDDSPYPETAERFCVHLLANVLRYHCLNHDCAPFSSGDHLITIAEIHTLEQLITTYEGAFSRMQDKKQQSADETIQTIKAYIDQNYHKPLRLDELAASFFLNKEYMGTVFHKKYGTTMSAYILQLKMNEAMLLLRQPELSISAVSRMLGYEDPAYFNRVFKKFTGLSPGQYKANTQKPLP